MLEFMKKCYGTLIAEHDILVLTCGPHLNLEKKPQKLKYRTVICFYVSLHCCIDGNNLDLERKHESRH